MEKSEYYLQERARYISEAQGAAFLDAVFLINYYNCNVRIWISAPKPEEITPKEVFGDFNVNSYNDALKRSKKLFAECGAVGEAFFKYPSAAISYEDSVKRLRKENPGFSERIYGLTISSGIRDMR